MDTKVRSAGCIAFGPFEANLSNGELRHSGVRVHLAPQPFHILTCLLARPGEVVTREELRERIWNDGTFVDFERGLNSAIVKLRRALGDSAEIPRFIETVPGRGYRFIGTLNQPDSAALAAPPPSDFHIDWGSLGKEIALGILLTIVCGLIWRLIRLETQPSPWKLSQLTFEGNAQTPALSPDGTLVAYSSMENAGRGSDLYVRRVNGGEAIRLTFDGANNTTPDFSPNGALLAFRSSRDGGGIYGIPALGGSVRLIARNGWHPRFSPDGSHVAYWTGGVSIATAVPGSGAAWVVPLAGGAPRQIGEKLTSARYPLWSPDGRHLLVSGYASAAAFDSTAIDWWLVNSDGGDPVRLQVSRANAAAGMRPQDNWRTPVPDVPRPSCWLKDGSVIFHHLMGDVRNIWRLRIASGKAIGPPERLTFGAGNEADPSCTTAGDIAFSKVESQSAIWMFPLDPATGKAKGGLEPIGDSPVWRENVSLSPDGTHMAFVSYRAGRQSVWVRNLSTGAEGPLAESPLTQRYPVIDPTGARVAYSVYERNQRSVYVAAEGGAPEKICGDCLRATDWSRDGQSLLVFGGNPYRIDLVDIATRKKTPLVAHAGHSVLYARFSPDNRWISFTERTEAGLGRVMIAAVGGQHPVPESAWISVAEAGADDYANWSADGNTLYFTSARDGYGRLWGQRLDARTRLPVGSPFVLSEFSGTSQFAHGGWSAAQRKIALSLVERRGHVWMMSRVDSRR